MPAPSYPRPALIARCPASCDSGGAPRRQALGLFAALLLAPLTKARAADDLLDPAVLLRKPSPAPQAAGRPDAAGVESPAGARTMAESVTLSLDGLTMAAAGRVADIDKLDQQIRDTQERLQRARDAMTQAMTDYRNGLFCSGCGKTRTEILKAGDTFPHPGQQIVQPTQAQIDAKQREMQTPIDGATRELDDLQPRRRKSAAERDEALAQIDAGLALWNTSLAYERQAVVLQMQQADRRYNADRQALDLAIDRQAGSTPAAKQARDDLHAARASLEKRRRARRLEMEADEARAADSAREQQQRIDGFLSRKPLQKVLQASATITAYVNPAQGFNDLGGLYRMGDFSAARHDEVLPRVEAFIAGFRSLPGAAPAPERGTPSPQRTRDLLKELLACEPDDADCRKRPAAGRS